MESRPLLWATIGVGLLTIGILGLIALPHGVVVVVILALMVIAGSYSLLAVFAGFWLPQTRTEPFSRERTIRFQWPVAFPRRAVVAAPTPDRLAEQLRERRAKELEIRVADRLADLPLRREEIAGFARTVDWALRHPLGAVLTDNAALAVEVLPKVRPNTQLFHMTLIVRDSKTSTTGYFMAEVASDQSFETLSECHSRLLRLVDEVRVDKDYWLGRSHSKQY
jgi:hypothetical protein